MMLKWKAIFLSLLFCVALGSQATEPYEFPNDKVRERFQLLSYELRCPKCQNQNIADSNAPIAKDLRREVHRMLLEGKTNDDIVQFMVDRYGDFVLYRPPFSVKTLALWLTPLVLVVAGVVTAFRLGRNHRVARAERETLSEGDEKRLQALLKEVEESDSSA